MKCPVCERGLSEGESKCSACGIEPVAARELIMRSRALGWTFGLILGVALSFVCLGYAGESAFFYAVWLLPPALGAIGGEAVRSYRVDQAV